MKKNLFKKALSLFAAAALCAVCISSGMTAGAVDSPNLKVENASAKAGQPVSVNITATNFSTVAGIQAYIDFGTALNFVSASSSYITLTKDENYSVKDGVLSLAECGQQSQTDQTKLESLVSGDAAVTFLTLNFTIPADAADNQSYDIKILTTSKVSDSDEALLTLGTQDGKVTVEPGRYEFTYSQNVQIRLIEPWGLKANAKVSENGAVVDYNTKFKEYGAYFLQSDAGLTVTEAQVMGSGFKYSSLNDKATVVSMNGTTYASATYDKGLYTYEFNKSIYVLFFFIDQNDNVYYAPIRERNLLQLVNERKDNVADFPNENERLSYQYMYGLYNSVTDYREGKNTNIAAVNDPISVSQYDFGTLGTDSSYSFGNNVQIRVIEPWGSKINAVFRKNGVTVDYNACSDYGVVMFYDSNHIITNSNSLTYNDFITRDGALVYSHNNEAASLQSMNGTEYITATYAEGIYTYQLKTDLYVVPFAKINGVTYYGDVKTRNLYDLCEARSTDVAVFPDVSERAVYENMYKLYDSVTEYRKAFIS